MALSLKEDFLEALRSVKNDIFRDSQYTGTGVSQVAAEGPAQPTAAKVAAAEPVQSSPAPGKPDSSSPPADASILEAFKQVADSIEDKPEPPDAGDSDDGLDELVPPSPAQRSMEFVPGANNGGNSAHYDFDTQDLFDDDKTVISKNTIIHGSVQTEDSLRLLGQIHGDVDCKANLVVAGKIRGNTSAANAYIYDAQIDGSVACDDSINVSSNAWVLGNIRAQQAEIDGKIKGNLEIRHTVSIGPSSSIIGNISTDELEIKRGAFVNGQILMYSPSRDVLDGFDDFKK